METKPSPFWVQLPSSLEQQSPLPGPEQVAPAAPGCVGTGTALLPSLSGNQMEILSYSSCGGESFCDLGLGQAREHL